MEDTIRSFGRLISDWIAVQEKKLSQNVESSLQNETWVSSSTSSHYSGSVVDIFAMFSQLLTLLSQCESPFTTRFFIAFAKAIDKAVQLYATKLAITCGSKTVMIPTVPDQSRANLADIRALRWRIH